MNDFLFTTTGQTILIILSIVNAFIVIYLGISFIRKGLKE